MSDAVEAGVPIDPHGTDCIALADLDEQRLQAIGFDDPAGARSRLQSLAESPDDRQQLEQSLSALLAALSEAATADGSLVNFQRLVQSMPDRTEFFRYLAANPRAVEILIRLFVGSQFLTEILLRNPDYLQRLVAHRALADFKSRQEFLAQIAEAADSASALTEKLNEFRRVQKWELLRLGACDSFGLMDLKTVTLQLALLADALVQSCLTACAADLGIEPDDFTVLAFGKLGGEELNYSSDIDLVFFSRSGAERYWSLGQQLIKSLMQSTAEGFLYRVDMRLRPWGRSGALVTTGEAYLGYLRKHGRLWEKQALLKARPIAGSIEYGHELLREIQPIIFSTPPEEVRESVRQMKDQIETELRKEGRRWGHVKAGEGSIRDVEFVTQYLQLAHGRDVPHVRSPATLDALVRLVDVGILQADEYRQLSSGYIFLRTIEHALQLMHNKPMHALPSDERELAYLARRTDFPSAEVFRRHYEQHREAIRAIFDRHVLNPKSDTAAPVASKPRGVAEHLGELESTYLDVFSEENRQRQLELLDQLGESELVKTSARETADGRWELTVVGYDHPGSLSLICGLLFVHGFDIEDGYVYTGRELPQAGPVSARPSTGAAGSRKFVDVFVMAPPSPVSDHVWTDYEGELQRLQAVNMGDGRQEAQGQLAKRVANTLLHRRGLVTPQLLPVEIDIDNQSDPNATVLYIRAEDTIGFLYELSNALALTGISILRLIIQSESDGVVDTLYVTDRHGRKITDRTRLQELRAAIVLIKHFTHLLPHSPNPEGALLNFRAFLEQLFEQPDWVNDLASLQDSQVLTALARLLGVSDFLWHDFLRLQHSNLFPVVTDRAVLEQRKSREQLDRELAAELECCTDADERRRVLNAFKDREMLRVDMRHILGLQSKFGQFSRELTDVAETVVDHAMQICWDELAGRYGNPTDEDGNPVRLSVCALGKCGGQELGFASDIELMFIYERPGRTDGDESIRAVEFFQKLVEQFRKSIEAKRKGIFEVDLRLRPYGKAGSLAFSLETFEKYFAPEGPAWPYERQALVKLRPIAGDGEFGRTIVARRDEFLYTGQPFDVVAMRAMRDKQVRQLVQAGTLNAKLSPGGLVDCEYIVQGLQITYGHLGKDLRVANTREAMKALQRHGILTVEDRIRLRDAYRFLRRVIDGLRMVRGDARDLAVPPADSEEFLFLARRLHYDEDPQQLARDLEEHMQDVLDVSRNLDELIPGAGDPSSTRTRYE